MRCGQALPGAAGEVPGGRRAGKVGLADPEFVQHPVAQELLLLTQPAPRAGRGARDSNASADSLVRTELLAGQFDLQAEGQAVPPLIVVILSADQDLAAEQFVAQQVMEHHSGGTALPERRVGSCPLGSAFRRAGIRSPAAADRALDVSKQNRATAGPQAIQALAVGGLGRVGMRTGISQRVYVRRVAGRPASGPSVTASRRASCG